MKPFWLVALFGLIPAVAWSAPAPKEGAESKDKEQEETVAPAELNFLAARAARKKSENNLKQIALAVHNHASAYNDQIPQNIVDKDGKALLSWRVRILPFIEEADLYKQFKLDEPWDSENNIKLLAKLPKVFENLRVKIKKPGYTAYLGFEGNGALFGSKYKIGNIPDGTSNTILCVESSVALPWTKPVDLPFDPKKDVPDFGKAYNGEPIIAICDGSVRTLNLKKVSAKTLKNAICTDDGNALGDDW